MRHIPLKLALTFGLSWGVYAQTQAAPPSAQNTAGSTEPTLTLTLQDALERARTYSQPLLAANISAQLAHEDSVQAKASLLPTASGFSQFIYTQPNGTPSGVFVPNDGPHLYNDQLAVHTDIYSPIKYADYRRAQMAEAVARARRDIAARGLVATVVQNYYTMVSGARRLANAQQSEREAEQFLNITQRQERGGEVAHFDTLKAEIQLVQRQRDVQEAQLALNKSRIGFSVLLFPDFRQDFTVIDDLETSPALPAFPEIQALAVENNPDIRAAAAAAEQQGFEMKSAQAALLPSLSFDYFYGIGANQFAVHNREGLTNLGSVAQAQLTIPIWSWGAAKSKVRQAELRLQQAKIELSLTQRQLLSSLHAFYLEANGALSQVASLRRSMDLSAESLRLTLLRYRAGEGSVLEVVDAQTTLVQARNTYNDGLVRYRLALSNLQTLTGVF
jgi:outer membrane protein TolC